MKRSAVLLKLLAAMCAPVSARAVDLELVSTFDGNKGPGWKASANVMGAVGPRHVVDFTVGGFTVHDKATGKALRHLSQREFWKQVEPADSMDPRKEANDPWLVYDPVSGRWFATVAGTEPAESFLAASASSDPTQAWKGVKLPLPRIDPGLKIGVDRNALYISCANGSSNPEEALDLYVIPKADAIAPGGPVLSRAQTFPKLVYAAVPAVDLDPGKAADAPAVLLNNEFGGPTCGRLFLYRIIWTGPKASISKAQSIPLGRTYQTPRMEGIQPEGGVRLVEAGGRRNNCAFVRGGSVFGCNGAQRTADSRPGILWYEVRIRDGALLQEGLVDGPDCDYLYPSMAVDSLGNIGIGCTRTSATAFPSVCIMMHAAGDPAGTMRSPVVAVAGTTVFKYAGVAATNFSNYSATCVDPSAPDLLWTYQGYSSSTVDRQWCTAWAAFKLSAAAPRPRNGEQSAMERITPHFWFDQEAREAVEFYVSAFPKSKITSTSTLHGVPTPTGDCDIMSFELSGQPFMAINAGPLFKFNPSISFFVNFDPSRDKEARKNIDVLWEKLSRDGKALMPLDRYPFSERYGWIQDRYGLSWQLMLSKTEGEERPEIVPSLLFVGAVAGRAEEAVDFYLSAFKNSRRGTTIRYGKGQEPDKEGTVMFSDFALGGQWFAAMDSAWNHGFAFNEAISLLIPCATQEEIDYYWEKLSADPKAERCGWLKDKYGVSWQVWPTALGEMLSRGTPEQVARVTGAFLSMKKFDLEKLKNAFKGKP